MAEADDSGDYQEKPKRKTRYRKELKYRHVKDKVTGKITSVKKWVNVGYPIKQPEPYIGKGGVVITGEFKPEYKRRKIPKKIYANKYTKKFKNVLGGLKHTIDYLRNPKDKKFLGHTDNKNK